MTLWQVVRRIRTNERPPRPNLLRLSLQRRGQKQLSVGPKLKPKLPLKRKMGIGHSARKSLRGDADVHPGRGPKSPRRVPPGALNLTQRIPASSPFLSRPPLPRPPILRPLLCLLPLRALGAIALARPPTAKLAPARLALPRPLPHKRRPPSLRVPPPLSLLPRPFVFLSLFF